MYVYPLPAPAPQWSEIVKIAFSSQKLIATGIDLLGMKNKTQFFNSIDDKTAFSASVYAYGLKKKLIESKNEFPVYQIWK